VTSKTSVIHRSRNSANSSLRRKINGRSLDVNADFAQQAIFLAQQLKCSEKYIASILHAIVTVNPQHGPSQLDRGDPAPRLYLRLEAFVRQELVPASKPDASLASHIFNEIESIGTAVTQAQIARQNAQSNTIPPSGPAFDSAEPHSFPGKVRKNLATDKGAIAYMKRQLAPNTHRQAPPPPRSPQPRSRNRGTTSGLPFCEKLNPVGLSQTYNASPSISWSTIFALLESRTSPAPNPRTNQPPSLAASFGGFGSLATPQPHPPTQQPPQHIPIGPKDVLLAQSFLRLLSTVATSSVAGAIFDALAAFCEPGAGVAGVDICKSVWRLMERVEVINVRAPVSGRPVGAGAVLPPVKGVEVELGEVEAVYKLYPVTIPFLNLLATLLHTPKRLSPRSLLADAEPLNTIPESLGQPYRLPGIGPYVSFMVDNVFAGLPRREYARHSERWRMNDLCLKFVERALADWEIENLVRASEDGLLRRETVIPLLIHPGFEVLTRLLTNSPLQSTILSYIVDGIEGFEHELPSEEPYFLLTIIRVLRIIHRVLEIQDVFLDVLVPILSEFDSAPFVGTVHSRLFYTRFDQALTYGTKYIPAIATYVIYPAYPELVLLAVRIISQLSCSTSVTSLLTLIERSPDSERILSGFRQLLDVDSLDDVDTAETTAEHSTGAGAADRETQEPLDQAIRIAILDLLIRNTERETTYPNFGHFLLFGGAESEHQIQDPHAIGARRTCVHVILDLVNVGVPRMRTKGKDAERQCKAAMSAEPLFNVLPALSVRCYRIIYQLCVHPRTSDATMQYLHTREDFFARHLAVIPSKVPEVSQEPFIEVMYHDGSRVLTSVSTLRAFIDLRSQILDLAALDLHVLTDKVRLGGWDGDADAVVWGDGTVSAARCRVCRLVGFRLVGLIGYEAEDGEQSGPRVFIESQRDTVVIMLKNDSEEVALSYIQEIHLLVSLSGSLLSLLTMNTGFGGIHGAILGLAARCLGNGRCSQSVRPQTDSEIALASMFPPGHQSETKFDVLVRRQELLLRKAVIEYLGTTASDFTEPEMKLVLSPVLSVPRQDERPPRAIATIPIVGDAIEALNSLCDDLAANYRLRISLRSCRRAIIFAWILSKSISDPVFLQDLDIAQKRSLIHQAYQRLKIEFQDKVETVLGTTEMLLLLLWRHLASYAETDPSRSVVPPPANMRTSMRLLPAVDASTFKDGSWR
ncbi:hypothetical protein EV363DRAFT_1545999, partial [Boletus edulis]